MTAGPADPKRPAHPVTIRSVSQDRNQSVTSGSRSGFEAVKEFRLPVSFSWGCTPTGDKALQKIIPESELGQRNADVLVQVTTLASETQSGGQVRCS